MSKCSFFFFFFLTALSTYKVSKKCFFQRKTKLKERLACFLFYATITTASVVNTTVYGEGLYELILKFITQLYNIIFKFSLCVCLGGGVLFTSDLSDILILQQLY